MPATPALWEASLGTSRIYLFGTVHTLPRGVDWFRPHVARALDQSERLVLETEIPESAAEMLPTIMRLARLPAPRPLSDRLPEAWQPALLSAVERLKPGPMDWYDSWFIALTLANQQAATDGFDPRIGVESVLSERARMRGLPIEALETMEQQLIYFDALSDADQQQLLIATLEDLDRSQAQMAGLVADWLAGNTDGLAAKVNEEFERSPMLRRMLVEERNMRFAQWIAARARPGQAKLFVAVGAGHLAGPGSLIGELEKRGFKVKQLADDPKRKRRGRANR